MKRIFTSILLYLAVVNFAQAHFVFVTPDAGGATARLFISEKLVPDLDAAMIAGTKLNLRDAGGKDVPLVLVKAEPNCYSVALSGSGTRVIHGIADLGVMNRSGKPHV